VKQFEERFSDLECWQYELLADINIEAHRFHAKLMALDVSRKHEHKKFIKSLQIKPETTFHDLWVELNDYWNFLNFELLEHVVSKFGNEDLKREMKSYTHDLQTCRSITRLCDFVDCWPVKEEIPSTSDLRTFIVEMKLDWDHCTLEDLETSKGAITHKFFLPDFSLLLKKINRGSIVITWLLPAQYVNALREAIQSTSMEFFVEQKIEAISIDGQDCYPFPTISSSGYPEECDTTESHPVGVSTPGPSIPGTAPTSQVPHGESPLTSTVTSSPHPNLIIDNSHIPPAVMPPTSQLTTPPPQLTSEHTSMSL